MYIGTRVLYEELDELMHVYKYPTIYIKCVITKIYNYEIYVHPYRYTSIYTDNSVEIHWTTPHNESHGFYIRRKTDVRDVSKLPINYTDIGFALY
jgi:hypothetical protein